MRVKIFTEAEDAVIRKCWENNRRGHYAAERAAEALGSTIDIVRRRATELGLIYVRDRIFWTDKELYVVEKYNHLSPERIQEKLRGVSPEGVKRTRSAIVSQIYANKFRGNSDGLILCDLAKALGVSTYMVLCWRTLGWLKGARRATLREGPTTVKNHAWFFQNRDIRRFVFTYPGLIDLRKVNQVWFMEMLKPAPKKASSWKQKAKIA
jgi:hypothetical protein